MLNAVQVYILTLEKHYQRHRTCFICPFASSHAIGYAVNGDDFQQDCKTMTSCRPRRQAVRRAPSLRCTFRLCRLRCDLPRPRVRLFSNAEYCSPATDCSEPGQPARHCRGLLLCSNGYLEYMNGPITKQTLVVRNIHQVRTQTVSG